MNQKARAGYRYLISFFPDTINPPATLSYPLRRQELQHIFHFNFSVIAKIGRGRQQRDVHIRFSTTILTRGASRRSFSSRDTAEEAGGTSCRIDVVDMDPILRPDDVKEALTSDMIAVKSLVPGEGTAAAAVVVAAAAAAKAATLDCLNVIRYKLSCFRKNERSAIMASAATHHPRVRGRTNEVNKKSNLQVASCEI